MTAYGEAYVPPSVPKLNGATPERWTPQLIARDLFAADEGQHYEAL